MTIICNQYEKCIKKKGTDMTDICSLIREIDVKKSEI